MCSSDLCTFAICTFANTLLLIPMGFVVYAYKLSLWLGHLRDTPADEVSLRRLLRSYHQIQVLHSICRNLVCPLLLPFGIFAIYCLGILFNVLLLVHHASVPIPFLFMYSFGAQVCAGVLVELGSSAASIHINSGQVVRRWTQHAKMLGNKCLTAHVRACARVGMNVGPFFVLKKSTQYNMILFLVLNTFKAAQIGRASCRERV